MNLFLLLFTHFFSFLFSSNENIISHDDILNSPTLSNDFTHFISSLPSSLTSILSSSLNTEKTLIDLIQFYQNEKMKIFPYEIFQERTTRMMNYASLQTEINIGIIFLGFPANSLPRMREMWFNQLSRTDHIHGVTSSQEDLLHIPGRVHIKQNFHVIETSIHLETALIKHLSQLAIQSSRSSESYFNSWEVDDLLSSLKRYLFDSEESSDSIQPSLVFFVVNLNLLNSTYFYRNSFSSETLTVLKESETIRNAATQVMKMIPHKSRVILDETEKQYPLHTMYSPSKEGEQTNKQDQFGFEKIRSSKAWATNLALKTDALSEVTIEARALSILKNEENSPIIETYRHILAKQILSTSLPADTCETDLWTGLNGVIWLDLHASEAPPISLTTSPYSTHSHRPLDPAELSRESSRITNTGTDYRPEDSLHEYHSLFHTLQQQHTYCIELLTHLTPKCPQLRTIYDIAPISSPEIRFGQMKDIATQIRSFLSGDSEAGADYCGLLHLQRTFLEIVMDISVNLHDSTQRESIQEDHREYDVYYNDIRNFHNRIISEVLETSSMFLGKGHFSRFGFSSEVINHAIARIAALTLGLSRQFMTRPITLHEKLSITSLNNPEREDLQQRIQSITAQENSALKFMSTLQETKRFSQELIQNTLWDPKSNEKSSMTSFYGDDSSQITVDEDMKRWGEMLPPIFIPRYIEIGAFVVKMQSTYESIDDEYGFNMPHLINQIQKLKLPNQQMTFSTHHIQGVDEPSLSLSLAGCRRYLTKGNNPENIEIIHYLSSYCVWRHLQHQQEIIDGPTEEQRDLFPNKHHLAVFILSVDEKNPIYLDQNGTNHLQTAVTFGDSVIVIQNQQTSVKSSISCAGQFVYENLRNPIGITLRAIGSALIGMNIPVPTDSFESEKYLPRFVATCGSSPDFGPLSGLAPAFNQFDLETSQRNRLLRSLEYAVWMASRNQEDLIFLRDHTLRAEGMELYASQILEAIRRLEWSKSASLLNSMLKKVQLQREKIDQSKTKRILELHKPKPIDKQESMFYQQWKTIFATMFLSALVSAVLSGLLFILFSIILSKVKKFK